MFYPYCIIGDESTGSNVVHTLLINNCTIVHFEQPDPVYCFKTMDCVIPSYRISGIVGFSDDEVSELIDFVKCNAASLLTYARCGGVDNA